MNRSERIQFIEFLLLFHVCILNIYKSIGVDEEGLTVQRHKRLFSFAFF